MNEVYYKIMISLIICIPLTLAWIQSRKKLRDSTLEDKLNYLRLLKLNPGCNFLVESQLKRNLIESDFKDCYIIELAESICSHLKISGIEMKISRSDTFSFIQSGKAGYYERINDDESVIYIDIKQHYNINHLVGIISHEAVHHLLRYNSYSDELLENEEFIDVAAVYFGFGQYLLKAYEPMERILGEKWIKHRRVIRKEISVLGYLSVNEIEYAVNRVYEIRLFKYLGWE